MVIHMVTSHNTEWTFQNTQGCQKRSGRPMSINNVTIADVYPAKPTSTAKRMMGCKRLMPNMYTIADNVKAPAPNAIEERSIVIHNPQGTESLILVMYKPLTKTVMAE